LFVFAAGIGDEKVMSILIDHCVNLTEMIHVHKTSLTPIDIAATVGHEAIVKLLLDNGALFSNSLHHACKVGDAEITKLLLRRNANPDSRRGGRSPLTFAVLGQHDSVIHVFVNAKADVTFVLEDAICKAMKLDP
jgi:ankyrin repeat protein